MAEPLRHRQTKEAATDMFYLTPPRHISTLHLADKPIAFAFVAYWTNNGQRAAFAPMARQRMTHSQTGANGAA